MSFAFEHPAFFLLLIALPCFWWCTKALSLYYLPKAAWARKWRLIPHDRLLIAFAYALMVAALATPYIVEGGATKMHTGRNLVVALDASGSMRASDFDAKREDLSKFDLLLELMEQFFKQRYSDNVGVVIFGTFAYPASPLTYDMNALSFVLGTLTPGLAGENTAIGEAIGSALGLLRQHKAEKSAIILITDGFHNVGHISPKEAVAKAIREGVSIYTIGLGSAKEHDAKLLTHIATQTGGRYFSAEDSEDLVEVFEAIDALEPSPIAASGTTNIIYLHPYVLLLILVFLLWLYTTRGDDGTA